MYRPSDDHLTEKPAAEPKHGPQIHKRYSGTTVRKRESFLNQLDIYFKKYERHIHQNTHKKALTALEHMDSTLVDRWYTEKSNMSNLPTREEFDQSSLQVIDNTKKKKSLAFSQRARTEAITVQMQRWLTRKPSQKSQWKQPTYRPQRNWRLDPLIATAPKHLASRYFQLKSGHAAIGTYLQWIQA